VLDFEVGHASMFQMFKKTRRLSVTITMFHELEKEFTHDRDQLGSEAGTFFRALVSQNRD
jgi:hypothetical protein